jgi:hypothetical protein
MSTVTALPLAATLTAVRQPCFGSAEARFQAVRLRCKEPVELAGEVQATIAGIEVGSTAVTGRFAPGDTLEIPIRSLPCVPLPARMQFLRLADGIAIGEPLVIASAEAALALVGPGGIEVQKLAVENGVVRGQALNRVNGLCQPNLFARVNRQVLRQVSAEQPRLMDEGGCSFGFMVRLDPADLGEAGLSIEIHAVGMDGPLASIVFARADAGATEARLVELEQKLRQIQHMMGLDLAQLTGKIDERLDLQQARIDAFIDHAGALIFDRLATEERPAPAPSPEVQEVTALATRIVQQAAPAVAPQVQARALLGGLDAAAAPARAAEQSFAEILPGSSNLSFGWYGKEDAPEGEFQWMGQTALVVNPDGFRPVAGIELSFRHVYGADAPMLRVWLDEEEAGQEALERPENGDRVLRLVPPGGPRPFRTLRIDSLVSGSPARDSGANDTRVLSVAVSRIRLLYA